MRLFVSYSRNDAAFVTGLVDELERRGHDVWVDTDDIRGSEPWRLSIVTAIAACDAVILVVSPESMSSSNVEKEITVAAENHRRIVPVVLEPAPLPPSLQYELAGVQHLVVGDRPTDEVLAQLETALRSQPVVAERPKATSSARARRESKDRSASWVKYVAAVFVVVGVVALAIVATRSDADRADDTAAVATSTTAAGVASVEPPEIALDAAVWFAGFEITATEARIDRDQGEVQVDVELTNTQRDNAQTGAILGVNTAVEAEGARLTVYCTSCSTLPPGNRVRDTFTAGIAADFRLEGASLVFGGATEHQAVIPLDGSPATSEEPVSKTASGVVDDGEGSTFTIERVEVVPALCSGSAEEIAFAAGPNDRVSVVVTGTARTDSKYGVFLVAGLAPPDGGAPFSSLTYSPAVYPGAPKGGIAWCFDVPAPASGDYRLAVTADGVATEAAPVTITL